MANKVVLLRILAMPSIVPLSTALVLVAQLIRVSLVEAAAELEGVEVLVHHCASLFKLLLLSAINVRLLLLAHVVDLVVLGRERLLKKGLDVGLQLAVTLDFWVVHVDETDELGQSVLCATLLGNSSRLHFQNFLVFFWLNFLSVSMPEIFMLFI